ncbi:hypothetical protein JHN61_22745 [Streptomyces sp. MBT67]|uniref:hypothetical protein n=1 Tax=Streptomyces TaxID=1883 RepID=UPI00190B3DB2|nr:MULTISPECIES: hypothetical protein [unclassified Streptomyces]MBK3531258.1 hypothetical protein [Streptomyces sp. MBT72]MBK3538989.1 hypothetical protein [Streptomyces sp. MBT67]MBK3552044.1 hypothetical protein [Streptomyces sp. MBT61]MBK6031750.1 hypothetical protein [Streptomyces sp. MBT59]
MEQHQRGARFGLRRIDHATRWAGIALCWSHATAIALTATGAILRTAADWWVVAWALTAALLISWALLRAAQKGLLRRAVGSGGGEAHPCSPEEPADYDRAA